MIARLACNLLLLNTDWSESRSRRSSIFSTTMKAATQLLKGRGFAYKRFAISRKVRVPIIEPVIRPSVATSSGKFVDLNMLVMIGGRERGWILRSAQFRRSQAGAHHSNRDRGDCYRRSTVSLRLPR